MTNPFPGPHELLRRHRLSAKKSWGQNFLISERAYRAIVDAAVAEDSDWIVEIGAGLGTLTARLAERVAEGMVIAIERDRDMVGVLEAELGDLDNVHIEPANALTYDLAAAARWAGAPIAVCGNLPYNIASPILFRILDAREHVSRAVIMLQREMADRILATPSTKSYGAMTVLVAAYARASRVINVRASGFVPPPRVDSAVVRLDFAAGGVPRVPVGEPARFADVVHAAFSMRRKTLRNALRSRYGDQAVDRALAAAEIEGGVRGETLVAADFARLAAELATGIDA